MPSLDGSQDGLAEEVVVHDEERVDAVVLAASRIQRTTAWGSRAASCAP